MAASRRASRPVAAEQPAPKREVNLSGFSDDELRDLARERDIEIPADADRDALLDTLTAKIAEQEAAAAPDASTNELDNLMPEASAEPDAKESARDRRRQASSSDGNRPVATRDILHAGRIIPAGAPLPDSVPEASLPALYERGAVE